MSESSTVEEKSPTSASIAESATPNSPPSQKDVTIRNLLFLVSFALIGLFFIPWVKPALGNLSGYDIQKIGGDETEYVWFIPAGGLLTLLALVMRKFELLTCQISGAIPFLALAYYRSKMGGELFDVLNAGAYFVLGAGGLLLVLPHFKSKQKTSKP